MMPLGKAPSALSSEELHQVKSSPGWVARWLASESTRPRVSIIIPAYNAESSLAECLARVFQSTYEAFEGILIDDGSTDGTREVAANFPVRVVPTEGRVGPAAGNLGARVAKGDILFFIDTDVMLRPDSIDRLVRRFAEGDVDALCGVQAVDMRYRDLISRYKNLWMLDLRSVNGRGAALLHDRGGHHPHAIPAIRRLRRWVRDTESGGHGVRPEARSPRHPSSSPARP